MPQAGSATARTKNPRRRSANFISKLHREPEGGARLVAADVERDVQGPLQELIVGPADADPGRSDHERSALGRDAEPLDADGRQVRLVFPRRMKEPDAGAGIKPN